MTPANVKLSKNELSLVCDAQFILTKNNIINKVYELFGLISVGFTEELASYKNFLPPEIFLSSPKIYKGEQYLSLPYVLLDHPRCFIKGHAFAVRCFFWWGNFFSITLHLEGKYAELFAPKIVEALSGDWSLCVAENQWQHHFEQSNYQPFSAGLYNAHQPKTFFKIAKKIPLQQWDDVYDFYLNNLQEIIRMLV